jgi:NAD(P)-dependent dehydrogenase (short-subunit alcohol dehydrogenase family)
MSEQQRVVMITGAAGNLGRAVAEAVAAVGGSLVLVDRDEAALAAAFGEPGPQRHFAPADLLVQAEVDSVVRAALDRFGRIDVLCNLAGGFRMGEAVHETTPQTWDFLLDLNARSIVHTAHAVVPAMLARGRGAIVNVAANAALRGAAAMGAYAASKSVVIRLTESMAAELREHGINVNCVMPSIIDGPENRRAMPDADPARWVAPRDLAAVIVFLASDAARAVHGAALPVVGLS